MTRLLQGHLSEAEERMLEEIVREYPFVPGPNQVASTIFAAVQHMFDGLEGEIRIDSYLLHNLAACAWVALGYDRGQEIPWDQGDHDYIILHTLRGLMETLAAAIRENRIKERDGAFYYQYFHIPTWYVDMIRRISAARNSSHN